jgi:hypothetical protein
VAEHIYKQGGSYLFGNSTCRKRWDEMVNEAAAQGKSPNAPFFEDGVDVAGDAEYYL